MISSLAAASHAEIVPPMEALWRVLSLQDYNTRVVVIGTTLLGLASGLAGVFLLLRKRSLLSDVVSHSALPGIGIAFIAMTMMGGGGKNTLGLLLGATATALLGIVAVGAIRRFTRLKDDAALAIVLGTFFSAGIALTGVAARMPGAGASGLESWIYGKTASMLFSDALLIGITGLLVTLGTVLLFKELALLCFDEDFAATQGWPVGLLDMLLMGATVAVTVIGLQAVGLILVVALLIIPPAAARLWTHRLRPLAAISAVIGGLACLVGSALSALMENLPAGAIIVLSAAALFCVSLVFGTEGGMLHRGLGAWTLRKRVGRQHLLRALAELAEQSGKDVASFSTIRHRRSWHTATVRGLLASAMKDGLVERVDARHWRLTESGVAEARRVVRNHRLWELFLITHADIAPSHVDRDADMIEHILDERMIAQLEGLMAGENRGHVPPSPHALRPAEGTA